MKTDSSPANSFVVAGLENIHKVYMMGNQQVNALAGVSVSFMKGDFWAIMGPSGSGKSTLLNILGCLDRPSSGRYLLQNSDVSTLTDSALSSFRLRYIGFIFQSFNLIAQLSVQRNIELPLYYLGWDAARSAERAKELAGMVGLEDRLNHRPFELSGGQMQRVAIARSLANDPDLLLADEPTGNLDSKTGDQILQILIDLNKAGKTIIIVTHEPDIAAHTKQQLHMKDGLIDRIDGAA